jgi:hypothetical protein
MRARPQQTGQSRRSGPLLNALIGAGTRARAATLLLNNRQVKFRTFRSNHLNFS